MFSRFVQGQDESRSLGVEERKAITDSWQSLCREEESKSLGLKGGDQFLMETGYDKYQGCGYSLRSFCSYYLAARRRYILQDGCFFRSTSNSPLV